jgi:putative lipoprotein
MRASLWSRWKGAPIVVALLLAPSSALAAPPDPAPPDPWFGPDKALHFTLSSVIAAGGYGMTSLFTDHLATRIAFGAGLGVTVGAAKEFWDLSGHGDPSWKDFTWDVLGTVVGVGIAVTFDLAMGGPARAPAH